MEFVFETNAPGERQRFLRAFQDFVRAQKIPAAVSQAADLALEEAITNIVSYGFADAKDHTIRIHLEIAGDELAITLTDDGDPFNPAEHPPPDISTPAAQRPIGGLGIHMIRQSMDSIQYERAGDRNILRLRKSLKT